MKTVHKNEKVECKICKKVLKNSQALKSHKKVHELKEFSCRFCCQKFSLPGQLKTHMKFHKNPEKFKCQICGHQAKKNQDLKTHLRTHDKNREKNLKCNQCDFKTDIKKSLQKHKNFHKKLDEKLKNSPNAVKCEKCPSVLMSKCSYKWHLRTTHGNRQKPQPLNIL
jgi:KRAB domain-containing zinc finger protein